MKTQKTLALLVLVVVLFPASVQAVAEPPDILGQWYGTWAATGAPWFTDNFSMAFQLPSKNDLVAIMYVPYFGLFNEPLPATIEEGPGGVAISIGIPGLGQIDGVLEGQSLSGTFQVAGGYFTGTWYAEKYPAQGVSPGAAPGPECDDLPPLYCTGDAGYCGELVPFEPSSGPGGIDPPYVLQTDSPYSWIRRDLMMVVQYATAKLACKTAGWGYGNMGPLALRDMSEEDGDTPGTDVGTLRHPADTHEEGKDIDTAYYQLYAPDNLPRPVGVHHLGYVEQYHLVEPPHALDKWRTALYVAFLSEHPRMRLIGVDGQVGLVLEEAIEDLVELGWLDADARATMPLLYEVDEPEDEGYGLYLFHHNHMHLSIYPGWDVVASAAIEPQTLNRASEGRFITAHFELIEGLDVDQIDTNSIALLLSQQWLLYAEPDDVRVSDYNNNGIEDLTVKFDRQQVLEWIEDGIVEISITGMVDGQFFQASDTINVLNTLPEDLD